jgi:hypothetical protein
MGFAVHCIELRIFAAKLFPAVERTVKSSARLFTPCSRARVRAWDESDGRPKDILPESFRWCYDSYGACIRACSLNLE